MKIIVLSSIGEYIFYFDQCVIYELYVIKKSFLFQVVNVDVVDYDWSKFVFVCLEICVDEVECGEVICLNNIFYDIGSVVICLDVELDLNCVVQFLCDNKDVKVELLFYIDSCGGVDFNMCLFQCCVQVVVDYIVVQGIFSF